GARQWRARPDPAERVLFLARDLAGTTPSASGAGEQGMTDPFVSVVTPVYNDEPYLEECIRSVLSQDHEDFEYIICNNHSTDRSGEIAADYASQDSRIRVVSPPEFSPQAKNFNFALREIS